MNQTGWNPPNSQFIQVKVLLLKMVTGWNPGFLFIFKSTSVTSSTFPIQLDFSQNQPAAITLNTGSSQTLDLWAQYIEMAMWAWCLCPNCPNFFWAHSLTLTAQWRSNFPTSKCCFHIQCRAVSETFTSSFFQAARQGYADFTCQTHI
jgi:hypothetical protein